MTGDPIIDEIRRYRDEYAARFNYDVEAMGDDMRRRYAERQAREKRSPAGRSSDKTLLPATNTAGSAVGSETS